MSKQTAIKPNRIEENATLKHIAGLTEQYLFDGRMNPTTQWQKLGPHLGHIPGQKSKETYGVCFDMDNGKGIEYLCGVEVSDDVITADLPENFVIRKLPPFTYAVFDHHGHVSQIQQTCDAIWKEWTPDSGYSRPENADFFFERYGEKFDPRKGTGDIEIWIPVTS